jgi:hypothetical protein
VAVRRRPGGAGATGTNVTSGLQRPPPGRRVMPGHGPAGPETQARERTHWHRRRRRPRPGQQRRRASVCLAGHVTAALTAASTTVSETLVRHGPAARSRRLSHAAAARSRSLTARRAAPPPPAGRAGHRDRHGDSDQPDSEPRHWQRQRPECHWATVPPSQFGPARSGPGRRLRSLQ